MKTMICRLGLERGGGRGGELSDCVHFVGSCCASRNGPECAILRQHQDLLFTTTAKERRYLMRKLVTGIFVVLIASSAKAQTPTAATDITAPQVQAFIKDAPHDRNSDRPIR